MGEETWVEDREEYVLKYCQDLHLFQRTWFPVPAPKACLLAKRYLKFLTSVIAWLETCSPKANNIQICGEVRVTHCSPDNRTWESVTAQKGLIALCVIIDTGRGQKAEVLSCLVFWLVIYSLVGYELIQCKVALKQEFEPGGYYMPLIQHPGSLRYKDCNFKSNWETCWISKTLSQK